MRSRPFILIGFACVLILASLLWWRRGPGGSGASESESGSAVTDRLDRLAWLAGCWRFEQPGFRRDEQWMRPDGGTMLGMGRTVADGRTLEYEYLRIEAQAAGLAYVAAPGGQAEAAFRLAELTDSSAAFEALEHDFPQRITYQLQPGGGLLAWIEGQVEGVVRSVEFPFSRVRCP